MKRKRDELKSEQFDIMLKNEQGSYADIARRFNVSYNYVYYIKMKKDEHPMSWGGKRWCKYDELTENLIMWWMIALCSIDCSLYLKEYSILLTMVIGFPVTMSYIFSRFQKLHYTHKKCSRFQSAKFTVQNMARYLNYINNIRLFDPTRLVYLDEVHFQSQDYFRLYGRGVAGKRVYTIRNAPLNTSYSVTIMTSIRGALPVPYVNFRTNSNTGNDFLNLITESLTLGVLHDGHLLCMDNASVHTSDFSLICDLCASKGVGIILLPPYSPELNPAEFIFNFVKKTDQTSENKRHCPRYC